MRHRAENARTHPHAATDLDGAGNNESEPGRDADGEMRMEVWHAMLASAATV